MVRHVQLLVGMADLRRILDVTVESQSIQYIHVVLWWNMLDGRQRERYSLVEHLSHISKVTHQS